MATDLPLDEKHCDSPLLPLNWRRRGGCKILASLMRSSAMSPASLYMLADRPAMAVRSGPASTHRRTTKNKNQKAGRCKRRPSAHGAAKGRRAFGGR